MPLKAPFNSNHPLLQQVITHLKVGAGGIIFSDCPFVCACVYVSPSGGIPDRLADDIYTVSQKNKTPNFWPYLHYILSDFQNFFQWPTRHKFATNSCLNIPSRFKRVAILPCEI